MTVNGRIEAELIDKQPKKPVTFTEVQYKDLNSRQQENFNFQKVAAHLADFGYNCLRLSDDWNGADFIACHIDGIQFLKVQLKSRLTFKKSYIGKELYIAFPNNECWYIYPHDEVMNNFIERGKLINSDSWNIHGGYSRGVFSAEIKEVMMPYIV
jgi:hypothetical protein